jgi:hypothetical protein
MICPIRKRTPPVIGARNLDVQKKFIPKKIRKMMTRFVGWASIWNRG